MCFYISSLEKDKVLFNNDSMTDIETKQRVKMIFLSGHLKNLRYYVYRTIDN